MFGADIAAGYVFAWLVRKVKRAAEGVDTEIDRSVDAGVGRLHDLVSTKLGGDPALKRAREEAAAGDAELSERTGRRLTDALEDAAEHDQDFARDLARALAAIQNAGPGDVAADTGHARATAGGRASTGVVRPGGAGSGSATAERTGDATADGTGSRASTGVDYS
jgi:hypothetical protein